MEFGETFKKKEMTLKEKEIFLIHNLKLKRMRNSKKKLDLEKFKVARINNLKSVFGGYDQDTKVTKTDKCVQKTDDCPEEH